MQVSFHLVFGGQCEAAFQFYERTLGGKIVSTLTYGNSPMAEQVPPEWRGKIASVERSCPTQRRASQHASCQRIFRGDRNRDNFITHPKIPEWTQALAIQFDSNPGANKSTTYDALMVLRRRFI
jgi:uncharacterized glyoxalase superfamily protein PhnB